MPQKKKKRAIQKRKANAVKRKSPAIQRKRRQTAAKKHEIAVIDTIAAMRRFASTARAKKKKIGFVPTMGALHEGHISLIRAAKKDCDVVIVSIFVNPTQFSPTEDLSKYPRTFDSDQKLIAGAGGHAIFYPTNMMMYPEGYATYVTVESLSSLLCGVTRPHHFRGVTTVVTKLFTIITPDIAYFGEKDYQQAAIIRRMTADLNLPVMIKTCPVIRAENGLALSSRNRYLSDKEKADAPLLCRSLLAARAAYAKGGRDVKALTDIMESVLRGGKTLRIDYIAFVDAATLAKKTTADNNTRIIMAVYCGSTRLIDNMAIR
ncbi:MAG: pantoate--beta-alanine ligase [Spirochaetes bacterium]|nr:pantoate--beta-alanine ligase [Spirochaetota bacterium]